MPRGRGIPRNDQLRAMNYYEANDQLEPWDVWSYVSLQKLADMFLVSKSTMHRWVNRDVLNADRRRSQSRRDRIKRTGR